MKEIFSSNITDRISFTVSVIRMLSTQLATTRKIRSFSGINVAETVKVLTELKHTPASPNSVRRMSSSSQNLYQNTQSTQPHMQMQNTQGLILSTFQSQSKVSYVSQSGGVVYAQPAQVMGGSPNAVRRITSFRSQSADRKSDGE